MTSSLLLRLAQMNYTEIEFELSSLEPWSEILQAYLNETEIESLEETTSGFKAYIRSEVFKDDQIENIVNRLPKDLTIRWTHKEVETINWNEEWEKNFDPVEIEDKIRIRAPFHASNKDFEWEILMKPKMSFGTGHHATTAGVLELMLDIPFAGKKVLDMGCGTAILSIAAEFFGSNEIDAVDIDDWAVENSIENVDLNSCNYIHVFKGSAEMIPRKSYNVVLANINKNVLLDQIPIYSQHLEKSGVLVLSGFYSEDLEDIAKMAGQSGLRLERSVNNDNWIAASFSYE